MSKTENVIKKWEGIVPSRTIAKLAASDFTGTQKYLDYMCKLWVGKRNSTEVVKIMKKFDSLLPYISNKDIYSQEYVALNAIELVIEGAERLKEEKSFVREEHIEVLIENDDFILLSPKTHLGSLKYGAGTKWCTASKNNPGTFTNYISRGYLFYLIRKKIQNNNFDKVAFYVERGSTFVNMEMYNTADNRNSCKEFLNSDWNYESIQLITSYINLHCLHKNRIEMSRQTLKDFQKTVRNINVQKIMNSLNVLGVNSDNIEKEFSELIGKLNEKVSSLKTN